MTEYNKREKLYKLSAVADAAGFSVRTVEVHAKKGLLPVVRVGPYEAQRVKESDMKKYLRDMKTDA